MDELYSRNLELIELLKEFKKLYDEPLLDIHTLLTVEVMITKRFEENAKKIDNELENLNKEIN